MSYRGSTKTISKLYPPQMTASHGQVYLYSPLEHWVETWSSTSLKDVIEIEGNPSQPFFMSNCGGEVVLQSEFEVLRKEEIDQWSSSFCGEWTSLQGIVSNTQKMGQFYVNVTESGEVNRWRSEEILQNRMMGNYNPESLKEITSKTSIQSGQTPIRSNIDVASLVKKSKNGYNLANIICSQDSILTLHRFVGNQGETLSKLCQTEITNTGCQNSFFRGSLPSSITSFEAENNTILAYGGEYLLLVDKRCENTVASFNDLPDSCISQVNINQERPELIEVARDNVILDLDLRKFGAIEKVVLTSDQDIEEFVHFQEGEEKYVSVLSKMSGKVNFYQKEAQN